MSFTLCKQEYIFKNLEKNYPGLYNVLYRWSKKNKDVVFLIGVYLDDEIQHYAYKRSMNLIADLSQIIVYWRLIPNTVVKYADTVSKDLLDMGWSAEHHPRHCIMGWFELLYHKSKCEHLRNEYLYARATIANLDRKMVMIEPGVITIDERSIELPNYLNENIDLITLLFR